MKNFIVLSVILLLAAFLRIYAIASVPPSPSLDEVSIGYNAYSILQTGKDEYGVRLPLLLRAYDDFRPALYVYLVVPFVKIFGLMPTSVRLPSVILSIATVFLTYFLVMELLRIHPPAKLNKEHIALSSTLLLAISPWHIYISRLGHEANAGLAFFFFGLFFFLRWVNKNNWSFILLSAAFFVLSFISYQAEKIFLPVFLVAIAIVFRKELLLAKKQVIVACLFGIIILVPFFQATFSPNALIRLQGTNVFSSQPDRFEKEARLLADVATRHDIVGQLIHNRRIVAANIFLEGYIAHFNPNWLFANAGADRHKVPGLGLFYLWEGPFILFGLLILMRKVDAKISIPLTLCILASALPGAITTDAPHAMRAYTMLPAPQIVEALGIVTFFSVIQKQVLRQMFFFALCLLILGSVIYFWQQYFIVFPKTQSRSFQYALSKTIPFVLANEESYGKIIFSNSDNLYQSYMFYLFFSQYNPKLYQEQGGTVSGGFVQTHSFGKYEFRPINWNSEKKNKDTLYVGNPSDFPNNTKTLFTGYYLDGEEGTAAIGL